ncbi:hypothetical protein C8R43DRAFT_1229395 [Mycena crocata]|nr:hypothetical protein C8R43DRAFT_1229395 [Mycena crocata]
MPFSTDTKWSARLLTMFSASHEYATEGDHYFGLYDKLLNYSLAGFDYFVSPRAPWNAEQGEDDGRTVDEAHARLRADEAIRDRYSDYRQDCPLPVLYGGWHSAIDPPKVPEDRPGDRYSVVDSTYLKDAWDVDILSADGFARMKEIVTFIKSHPVQANVVPAMDRDSPTTHPAPSPSPSAFASVPSPPSGYKNVVIDVGTSTALTWTGAWVREIGIRRLEQHHRHIRNHGVLFHLNLDFSERLVEQRTVYSNNR